MLSFYSSLSLSLPPFIRSFNVYAGSARHWFRFHHFLRPILSPSIAMALNVPACSFARYSIRGVEAVFARALKLCPTFTKPLERFPIRTDRSYFIFLGRRHLRLLPGGTRRAFLLFS